MMVAGIMAAIMPSQIICIRSLGVTMMSQRNAATTRTAMTSMVYTFGEVMNRNPSTRPISPGISIALNSSLLMWSVRRL